MGKIKRILCIQGFSKYNALRVFEDEMVSALKSMGVDVFVVGSDMSDGAQNRDINEAYHQNNFDAVFSMNGVLADKKLDDGTYLMDHFKCPFYGYYVDHPYFNHGREIVPLKEHRALVVENSFRDYLEKFYPNLKSADVFPQAGLQGDSIKPYAERENDVVFMGTYRGHEHMLEEINADTSSAGDIYRKMAEIGVSDSSLTLEDILMRALNALNLTADDKQFRDILSLAKNVDFYLRTYFREEVVRTVVDAGIDITVYGEGWEKLKVSRPECLHLHAPVDYREFPDHIGNSKIVLNVLPWAKEGFHDRIACTMLNGALSMSDESGYISKNVPEDAIVTYSLENLGELPDKIRYYLSHIDEAENIAQNGRVYAESNHTWEIRAKQLLDIMEGYMPDDDVITVWGDIKSEFEKKGYDFYLPYKLHGSSINLDIPGEGDTENVGKNSLVEENALVNKPKYLMLTHQLSLTGAPLALKAMGDILGDYGNIIYACPDDGPLKEVLLNEGYPVVLTGKYYDRRFVFKGFAKKFDMCVVNTVLNFPAVMLLSGEKIPVKWWIHEHENYFEYGKGEIPDPKALGDNVVTYAISDYVKETIRKNFNSGVEVLTLGVDDYINDENCRCDSDNTDLYSAASVLRLVNIGALSPEKGQDILINAFLKLEKSAQDKLDITFIGAKGDEEKYEMYKQVFDAFPNLHYIGPKPHEEVLRRIEASDGVVISSRLETLSIVAIEGMISSRLVITSKIGISSYMEDGVNAFIYNTEDVDGLAEVLSKAIKLPAQDLAKIGNAGRRLYEENFSMEIFRENVVKHIIGNTGN